MSMEDSLSGNLIESILEACSNEASISEMINAGTSYYTIKKCLFYLIEFGMISYNGEKRVYHIRYEGWNLLSHINAAKKEMMVTDGFGNEDIVISFEP
jgi:predicted transcriptional regulator